MAFSIAFYTSLKNKIQGDADNQCKVVFDFIKKNNILIDFILIALYLLFGHKQSPNCLRIFLFSRLRQGTHGR